MNTIQMKEIRLKYSCGEFVFWIHTNPKTNTYDVWMHETEMGVATFCFGLPCNIYTLHEVVQMVKSDCFEYIDLYMDTYMEGYCDDKM